MTNTPSIFMVARGCAPRMKLASDYKDYMVNIIQLIYIFWSIRTVKLVLFWIYLWQLKNYHIGRFVDHFRTYQGKKLLLDPLFFIKLFLLQLLLLKPEFTWILLILYIGEFLLFARHIIKKTVKKPVITKKTILLLSASIIIVGGYGFLAYQQDWPATVLLVFDILTPIIISAVVLFFQPFFVITRLQTLKKAREKIAKHDHLIVIGITGSYGKTSTKEFLTTLLSSKFKVLATHEHQNSEMGIANTILKDLKPDHKVFVVEMGAYQKGGIKLLCDMVKPDIGIVTGVNQQHLATFGSLANLLSAEGGQELVKALPNNGLIVLNADNPYCLDLYKKIYSYKKGGVRKRAYTLKKDKIDADIWTEDIIVGETSLSFIAKTKQKEVGFFNLAVLGKQQVQNLLGAIITARELGVSMEVLQQACATIRQEQAGMTLITGIHGIKVIDSSYSSNPDGVMADLDYLQVFAGKKAIIMPCLIELGNTSAQVHRQLGKKIAQVCDLAIITTKDKFKEIKESALQNGMQESQIILCDKPQEILHHVTMFCKQGDAVLLEGRVPSQLISSLHAK